MILDEICAYKKEVVAAEKLRTPLSDIEERIGQVKPARDFRRAMRAPGISLIAEIKRQSPAKGLLMQDIEAVALGGLYEQAGARAISVLTDEKYFKGSLDDLTSVRQTVTIPCLRKEFIVDSYQIYEARAAQADAILLIVRVLSDEQLKDYQVLARRLGMSVLVEAHDEHEIERALKAGSHIIGINNRDLATFNVDINTTLRLKKYVPGGHVLVSESGIHTRQHVKALDEGGVDAVLVGEALVTSKNISHKIRELLGTDES
jgi:indole-3-glycerol phosphate synthase